MEGKLIGAISIGRGRLRVYSSARRITAKVKAGFIRKRIDLTGDDARRLLALLTEAIRIHEGGDST